MGVMGRNWSRRISKRSRSDLNDCDTSRRDRCVRGNRSSYKFNASIVRLVGVGGGTISASSMSSRYMLLPLLFRIFRILPPRHHPSERGSGRNEEKCRWSPTKMTVAMSLWLWLWMMNTIFQVHWWPDSSLTPGVGNGQANNQQGSKCGGYGSRIMRNLHCGELLVETDTLQPPRTHIVQYPSGEHSFLRRSLICSHQEKQQNSQTI